MLDEQMIPHDREILLKDLESILPAKIPYRAMSPVKLDKINDDVVESILEHLGPKGGSNPNVGVSANRDQDKIMVYPKFRPVDTSDTDLRSKLLFVQRIPSDKIVLQIRPNLPSEPNPGFKPQPTRDIATQVLEQTGESDRFKFSLSFALSATLLRNPRKPDHADGRARILFTDDCYEQPTYTKAAPRQNCPR